MKSKAPIVFAIAAHPDDIEFMMGGTLLLLKEAGCELHYMTLSNGSLGSSIFSTSKTRRLRREEAREGARLLGAEWHAPLVDDLEIFYDLKTLRRVAAIVRAVNPSVVLTHSPVDYMEDHTNTCRLAVTATFARGMPNFITSPRRPPVDGDVAVYHAMPHMLRDPLGRRVIAELFIDVAGVLAEGVGMQVTDFDAVVNRIHRSDHGGRSVDSGARHSPKEYLTRARFITAPEAAVQPAS